MKTKRFLLAAAITMAAAACSGDVTAPDPAVHADEAAAAQMESTATTPATPDPEAAAEEENGAMGSGVGR